jgi:catechol 2,3-dioxygenase-like lactoylglutathione lyase family enzyme
MDIRQRTHSSDTEDLAFEYASVVQVRFARPTDQLEAIVAFYRDGLGLEQIGEFRDHDGYDGVMLGLPAKTYHLEFTQRAGGSPCPAPTADNLLVLYIPDGAQMLGLRERLARLGHAPVAPENPYWLQNSVTYEDPDGWRVVLCNAAGI